MARMEWGPAEAVGSVPEVEPAEVRPSRRTQATAEDEGLAVAAAEVEVQSGDGEAEGSVVGPERAVAAAEAMDVQPGDGVAEAVPMEAPDGGTSTTHELDAEKELHAADPKPACAAASGLAPLDAEAYRALPSMRVDPSSLPAGCAGTAHNRFADVLPTPGTRVVLPGEDDAAQYINANRLRSPPGEPCRYIAAMGPIPTAPCRAPRSPECSASPAAPCPQTSAAPSPQTLPACWPAAPVAPCPSRRNHRDPLHHRGGVRAPPAQQTTIRSPFWSANSQQVKLIASLLLKECSPLPCCPSSLAPPGAGLAT